MPYRCAIFDLDGTLFDTLSDLVLAVNRMRAEFHLPPHDACVVRSFIGGGFEHLLALSLADSEVTTSAARSVLHRTYRESLNESGVLYEGVESGLRTLRRNGWKLALFSNKPEPFCKYILKDSGILDCFDLVLGETPERALKPDPEGVFQILRTTNAAREDAWMLGDSVCDIQTARNAGIHAGFARWGYGTASPETPEKEFEDFTAFMNYILENES